MSVDWVSLVIVIVAYVATRYSKLSLKQQNLINAVSMFAVVGWRLYSLGPAGTNALITAGAGVLGLVYLVRALRGGA
jgi:hypothetical protein